MKRDFSAAHKLYNYEGNCANLHGHTWNVEVIFQVPSDVDMVYDFRDLKDAVDDVLPDHKYLNECYDFNPTAENIVKEIFYCLKRDKELPVLNVTIWESKDAGASYP